MSQRTKKLAITIVKWTIAIGGMLWVVSQMSLWDRVLLLNPTTNLLQSVRLVDHALETDAEFKVIDPDTGKEITVPAARIVNPATPKKVSATIGDKKQPAELIGVRLEGDINKSPKARELLVKIGEPPRGVWIDPSAVEGGYVLDVPRPRVEEGIISMVRRADPWLLLLAMAVFPTTFLITSYRWNRLLQAVDVNIGFRRAFVITMVGAFYNTFMPGSVGGDVFKMYYVAKQTPHRTRAVVSVLIDRILGLLALVILGGVMATYQYVAAPNKNDAMARACLNVSLGSVAIMVMVAFGMAVIFQPTVRKLLGLEYILNRLPMQAQVEKARDATRIYRARPVLMLVMLLITLPVHLTVVVSTMLCGQAFDLSIDPLYYFTIVPVIVLVGAIPISPQGAGVMEIFAIMLTQQQGATVSEAFVLTMSIRMVQILWNLTGGIFVLRGGYHAPTALEQKELGQDDTSPTA